MPIEITLNQWLDYYPGYMYILTEDIPKARGEEARNKLARDNEKDPFDTGEKKQDKELVTRLSQKRAKPAVFFGGKTRIIDFALSNALNSGIRRIAVATAEAEKAAALESEARRRRQEDARRHYGRGVIEPRTYPTKTRRSGPSRKVPIREPNGPTTGSALLTASTLNLRAFTSGVVVLTLPMFNCTSPESRALSWFALLE